MITIDRPKTISEKSLSKLSLESTLEELTLYDFQVEANCLGAELPKIFEANPLLPGVTLIQDGQFAGMISRQRFWEKMSRPYGLELYSKRPVNELHKFLATDHLVLSADTSIVVAAQRSLQRSPKALYEPVIVQLAANLYQLLDVHQLLLAQSKIHELTTQLLQEHTQAQLIQNEKMSALGQMVASVAHEILNPVNFICGNITHLSNYGQDLLEVLSTYEQEVPQGTEKINQVKEELDLEFVLKDFPQVISSIQMGAERLRKTITALRSFSHMDEAVPKPTDIHSCLEDTLLILHGRLKYHIEVVKNYGELPAIKGFSGQLGQVFMNLIGNAIDALMEVVNSHSRTSWKPKIIITTEVCSEQPDWISIQIEDNGTGIPAELQKRIFETFFTTKSVGQGTGLGLTISKQIVVEKHRGQLNLWSEPGVGTRFEIRLPI